MLRQWILILAAFFAVIGASTSAVAAPDLAPTASLLARGVVSVRNSGDTAAGPTIVTITCHRPGATAAERITIPRNYRSTYTNSAYPDRIVVNVPPLAPGAVYAHTLPFWATMMWPPRRTFHFDIRVDASGVVAEGNAGEANNTATYVKVS